MGYRISIIVTALADAESVLNRLGLKSGVESDIDNESPVSGAPNDGQYLIWVNDDHRHVSHEDLAEASSRCGLLTLRANETVMYSEITKFENGRPLWSLMHYSEEGPDHLAVWGEPPAGWPEILSGLRRENEGDDDTDYVFDVPVILFEQLTGFRYDRGHNLPFVALEEIN
jgi:hypothetical protein